MAVHRRRTGGPERLYVDALSDQPGPLRSYGHDLATGAAVTGPVGPASRWAGDPQATAYEPAYGLPDASIPLRPTTGRTVYHWHTRTKTRRAPQLQRAAPAMWLEVSRQDADRLGIKEGDIVRATTRRGSIDAPARMSNVREGVVFAPWHYGDDAANDLTLAAWDPVSKQPEFKVAAVALERLRAGDGPAPAPAAPPGRPSRTDADHVSEHVPHLAKTRKLPKESSTGRSPLGTGRIQMSTTPANNCAAMRRAQARRDAHRRTIRPRPEPERTLAP
jgi:formylmethanofuran dehydrogenase subunit D